MPKRKKTNHSPFPLGLNVLNQASWAYKQFKHKRDQIAKEVKHYADGMIHVLNHADILPDKEGLLKEVKQNLKGFIRKIQKSNVAHMAMDLLDFPTKKDVVKLSTRLSQLEKRLNLLSRQRNAIH